MKCKRSRSAVCSFALRLFMVTAALGCGQRAFAQLAPTPIEESDYRDCQSTSPEVFRSAIEAITWKVLSRGLKGVDYPAVVREEWYRGEVTRIIEARVDAAVEEIRNETSWSKLLQSLTSREQAQELATAVAERVYRSDPVKDAIANLSTGVGNQIGAAIVLTAADAAEPAERCVQMFLGPRYGGSIAAAVSKDAGAAFALDAEKGKAGIGTGRIVVESAGGLTGVAVLLVRRQLAQMARRLGQRIVGTVLSRLVSVVAGGVGIALIAKDIWDLRHGMLPIIGDEMKSAETMVKVQAELASSIEEQVTSQTREIAKDTAVRVVGIWDNFQRAHQKVLALSESDAAFKSFVASVGVANLQKLDEIVGLIAAESGDAGVSRALSDGTLQRALFKLPDAGLTIARETRSVPKALAWFDRAGDDIDRVAVYELHHRTEPDAFTKAGLSRLLGLDDRLAVTRLVSIDRASRDALFDLNDDQLKFLSRGLSEAELSALSGYIGGLSRPAQTYVLEQVAARPANMQSLAPPGVRQAVLASRDQRYAVEMLLRQRGTFDLDAIFEDAEATWAGKVSPRLLWDTHPIVIATAGLAALLLLLVIRGLIVSGGRRRTATVDGPSGESQS